MVKGRDYTPRPKPEKQPKKLPQPISRYSKKKPREIASGEKKVDLTEWFPERRIEMTGICANCGDPSAKFSDEWYRCSICHLLPQRFFPSVADHEFNWIELCHFNKSCHTNMDSSSRKFEPQKMKCWPEMVKRFKIIYPLTHPSERRHIPDIYLQELEPEEVL